MKDYQQKFDNFLKDNEAKRCRAMRKVNRERELTNKKQADLLALQEEMKSLVKERDKLMKRVKKNAIYPRFLDKVVQASPQFQEVRQLMSRYYTLKLMSEDLLQITQQNQESMEKSQAQLAHFTKQGNDTILQYNNTLSHLQSQLDEARAEGMIWESRWAHIQNTAAKKTLLLGTIKMATLNLYQSVCKRAKDTGDAPIAPEDTLKQLEKIQTFLSDLISMWEEVSRSRSLLPGASITDRMIWTQLTQKMENVFMIVFEQRWNVFSVARGAGRSGYAHFPLGQSGAGSCFKAPLESPSKAKQ
ncbi:coiled-coil domain-containing protein 42-like [Colossoma macropomum]|uniref:coiled-coil domain-containing protein 42-like n=1 Tax=Colossoma macropomum TaxID=42526 RepID=UPI0018653BC4|nr:coiled-coil domain-containing protein 42-like [Colossoma macropomum]